MVQPVFRSRQPPSLSLLLLGTGLFGLAFMLRKAKPNGAVLQS